MRLVLRQQRFWATLVGRHKDANGGTGHKILRQDSHRNRRRQRHRPGRGAAAVVAELQAAGAEAVAVYLASEEAGYITGHVLAVDGGFLSAGVMPRKADDD